MSSSITDSLADPGLGRKEKILLILSLCDFSHKQVKDIKALALAHGLVEANKWNISQVLKDLEKQVVKLPNGWTATSSGKKKLGELGLLNQESPVAKSNILLRKYLSKVKSESSKSFLDEAVTALEYGLLRSAVVLSWVGAVSILYEEVVHGHLSAFNAEATKRNPKWKPAKNVDGLTNLKEHEFLQIISAISVLGKNTKQELEQCLKLRNSCGHPSTLKLGENRVASHIEILVLNIYQQYNPI